MKRIKIIVLKGAIIHLTTNQFHLLCNIGSQPDIYQHNLRPSYDRDINNNPDINIP